MQDISGVNTQMLNKNSSFWFQKNTIIAIALSILALTEIIDLTIVAVALPDIMGSLGATINEISLTITSYIVAAAIFIPLTGIVTTKFGNKKIILLSTLIFGISSICCGLSTTVTQMVIFRLFQGIGGAFLPSLSQSYIMTNFKDEAQNKMMTFYSLCVVLGPIIGPIMGGVISENLSWQWIFYVNVPLCILGFLIIYILMPEDKHNKHIKADFISFIYMALGIGCLEYFIDEGNQNSWLESKQLVIILSIAIIFLIFFFTRAFISKKSVINFQIFKYRNYSLSCLAMFIFMVILTGMLSFFPTLLQQSYGFPVDLAGYITAPRGLAAFIAAPIFMNLSKKIDSRILLFISLILFALGSYLATGFSINHNNTLIIITSMIQGFALIGFFILLIPMSYVKLPHIFNSDASGVFNFFRNFGSSVGTSVASTILSRQSQVSWNDMAGHISRQSYAYMHYANLLHLNQLDKKILFLSSLEISKQAFIISNLDLFFYAMCGVFVLIWIPMLLNKLDKPINGLSE